MRVQHSIDRVKAGDPAARDELICSGCDRLDNLIMKMLGPYEQVKRSEQADLIVQRVMMRLYRSLEPVTLESSRDFLRQASVHIRRELVNLAESFFGVDGSDSLSALASGATVAGESLGALDPARLVAWTDFHRRIELLGDDDREAFDLLWYQGLTQSETADLLGASRRTMIGRWQGARLRLFDALAGQLPPTD
jgi:DNA-directed RNA polymerase specialized sigma24 family protein